MLSFILLIVPYGIETTEYRLNMTGNHLLIVPYGIETQFVGVQSWRARLLIVPYGIETQSVIIRIEFNTDF